MIYSNTIKWRLLKQYLPKVLFFISFFAFPQNKIYAQTTSTRTLLDTVYEYLIAQEIKHPDIVLRQIIVETGWLKSPYLMTKHNLFAFRNSKGYMSFPTWQHSVEFYKKWQSTYYLMEKEDYYTFLTRIKYASSPTYAAYLKKIQLPQKFTQPKALFEMPSPEH